MMKDWFDMLTASGLGRSSNENIETIVSAYSGSSQLVDLSDLCIVDVTGADASSFLQGQFCNDLTEVTSDYAQITGYCTPKGRLLALPMVIGINEGYRLLLPQSVKEAFIKRLSMFVMRADVTFTERTDWLCTGLITDPADAGVAALDDLPSGILAAMTTESRQLIRWFDDPLPSAKARYLILASVTDQLELWKGNDNLQKNTSGIWRLGDINAGIPSITPGVVESFVPQMVNLQLLKGLSFKKGCYPGQEIVARMHYLGKLKRHMRLFHLPMSADNAVASPPAGAALSTPQDAEAGVVVDAVVLENQSMAVLAVVKVSANQEVFHWENQPLEAVELPYELPTLAELVVDAG